MDSRQLAYFRQIVESGSMSGAARALGIAQPSLTQQTRNLEAMLGVELLVRTARGVVPTEAGQRLHGHACDIARSIEAARADVVGLGSDLAGRVAFGMPASVSMALSIPMAETIRLERPRIRFCAAEAMSGHIKEWVLTGEVDLAILYDTDGIGDCPAEAILHEDLWFYAGADDWPFDTRPGVPVPLAAALAQDLVLPSPRHGLRAFVDRMARGRRLVPRVGTEMDSLSQIKSLVARGSGHTILSPAAVHDLTADGTLIGSPVVSPPLRRPIYLVRSARKPVTAASRAVEDTCRVVVADLVRRGIWQAELPAAA